MSESVEEPIEEEAAEIPIQAEGEEGDVQEDAAEGQEEAGEAPALDGEAADMPAQDEEAGEYPPQAEGEYAAGEEEQENRPQLPVAKRLERNPYYAQFLTSLHNLITYEVKIYGQASPEAKQHLSDLIAELSNQMWSADDRLSQGGASQKRVSVSNASISKRSHNQSIRQSDPEFLSMSDFAKIKGASFSKAPKFQGQKEKFPGPGDYNAEKVRPRSPGVVISQSPRAGLFKVSDSPGPGSYYPMRHFVSK